MRNNTKSYEKFIEVIWFVIVVALFVFSIKMIRSGELQTELASFGIWTPIILILLKASTLVIAPLGGTPLYLLAGALFGNVNGLLLALLGDLLGSTICFYLSRIYGQKALGFFAGSQNVERVLKTVNIISTTRSFSKARLGFVSMPELLAYAAGLSKISFWKFTIVNILFYIPVDIVLVFFGSQIAEVSLKYFFVYPLVLGIFAAAGFLALYKDYQKEEGI